MKKSLNSSKRDSFDIILTRKVNTVTRYHANLCPLGPKNKLRWKGYSQCCKKNWKELQNLKPASSFRIPGSIFTAQQCLCKTFHLQKVILIYKSFQFGFGYWIPSPYHFIHCTYSLRNWKLTTFVRDNFTCPQQRGCQLKWKHYKNA